MADAFPPLEASRPPWYKGTWPRDDLDYHRSPVPNLEEREAVIRKQCRDLEAAFVHNRVANRLDADGEATVLWPVKGLELPLATIGPRDVIRSSADLRSLLRTEILRRGPDAQPKFAKVKGRESEGLFILVPDSYLASQETVEVISATYVRQVNNVKLADCQVSVPVIT